MSGFGDGVQIMNIVSDPGCNGVDEDILNKNKYK